LTQGPTNTLGSRSFCRGSPGGQTVLACLLFGSDTPFARGASQVAGRHSRRNRGTHEHSQRTRAAQDSLARAQASTNTLGSRSFVSPIAATTAARSADSTSILALYASKFPSVIFTPGFRSGR